MPDCSACNTSSICTKCSNSKYLKSDSTGCITTCDNDPNSHHYFFYYYIFNEILLIYLNLIIDKVIWSDNSVDNKKCIFCNSNIKDCLSCVNSEKCT